MPVEHTSQWNTLFPAPRVDSHPSVTMKYETLLGAGYLRCAVCDDVCIEPTLQPITGEALSAATAVSEDGAILVQMGSGEDVFKGPTLTFESSTIMPIQSANKASPPLIKNMSE